MEKSKIKLTKNAITLEILPDFGGRISSIKVNGRQEWITQPKALLVNRTPGDNFIRPEISGWDEMVPTTDACESLNDFLQLPDHGEVWARKWEVTQRSNDSASLEVVLNIRTLKFSRSIKLRETTNQKYEIELQYSLENIGTLPIPAFWSCHPMFKGEGLKRVQISNSIPLEQTAPTSPPIEQSFLPSELQMGTSVEYWAEPDNQVHEIKIERTDGEVLEMSWNNKEIPYFGIFLDNHDYCKELTISPQPAIAYKVSERSAEIAGRIPLLNANEKVTWSLFLFLS